MVQYSKKSLWCILRKCLSQTRNPDLLGMKCIWLQSQHMLCTEVGRSYTLGELYLYLETVLLRIADMFCSSSSSHSQRYKCHMRLSFLSMLRMVKCTGRRLVWRGLYSRRFHQDTAHKRTFV